MMRYRDSGKVIPRIGRELQVDAVVEGSVQKTGDEVLVRTRLIDARTDDTLLAREVSGRFEGIISLENEVTRTVVSGVRPRLSPPPGDALPPARPVDPKAYEAYLRGLYLLNKRENPRRAVEYFETALRIEPSNALAHAQLAHAYLMLSAYADEPPLRVAGLAGEAATEALRLDPSLPEGLVAQAAIRMQFEWKWEEAEALFLRALEIAPHYALAHHWYALSLAAQGKLDEALAQVRAAKELEPDSPLVSAALGRICYFRREYTRAHQYLGEALELEPGLAPAHLARGLVFLQEDQPERSLEDFQEGLRAWSDAGPLLSALRLTLRQDPSDPPTLLERLDRPRGASDLPPFSLAILSAFIGDSASTLDSLERAARDRSEYVVFLDVDPLFDFLHGHPRFRTCDAKWAWAGTEARPRSRGVLRRSHPPGL